MCLAHMGARKVINTLLICAWLTWARKKLGIARVGARSVQVPNFDRTYVSVPNFFGIHNKSFFKFLPDLKYLT